MGAITKFSVRVHHTEQVTEAEILVSVTGFDHNSNRGAEVTVGKVGRVNVSQHLKPGDAIIYDAGATGRFDIRLLSVDSLDAKFQIAQV